MKIYKSFLEIITLFFLLTIPVLAETYPSFENGMLTIPRIDTSDKAGFYQNATFNLNPSGTWELQSHRAVNTNPLWQPAIEQAELIVTDSFPTQVFLKVKSGDLGCTELGQINQRIVDNRFEIEIFTESPDLPLGTYSCTAEARSFEKTIPLSVYDLTSGDYEYSINGTHTGTFSLTKDNKL